MFSLEIKTADWEAFEATDGDSIPLFLVALQNGGNIARVPRSFLSFLPSFFFFNQNRRNRNVANISLSSKLQLWFLAFYVADRIIPMVYKTQFSNLPSDICQISNIGKVQNQ